MKIRHGVMCVALLAVTPANAVAEPAAGHIALPKPRTEGTVSVETALHQRRSLRAPAVTPLTLTEVGQLCWAAQGIVSFRQECVS